MDKPCCRTCEGVENLMSIYHGEDICIPYKLMTCANIQISEEDKLPQHVCSNCLTILNISFHFKLQCENTDVKLRERYKTDIQLNSEVMSTDIGVIDISNLGNVSKSEFNTDFVIVKQEPLEVVSDAGENYNTQHSSSHSDEEEPFTVCKTKGVGTKLKPLKKTVGNKPDQILSCGICSRTFQTKMAWYKHKRIHGERKFKCKQCPKTFFYKKLLEQHMNVHVSHDQIKWYQCDQCPKKYAGRNGLHRHGQIHRMGKSFVCKICGKEFAQKVSLCLHEAVHIDERNFQCEQCPRNYKTFNDLRGHITRIHVDRSNYFSCDICTRKYKDERRLMWHKQQHLEGVAFDPQGTYKKNSFGSSDIKGICTVCGKTFKSNQTLMFHKKTHTGEKDYQCNICFKQFTWPNTYRNHMRIHNDIRNYKCSVCSKAFRQSDHLKRHFMTHTNERPHPCLLCERRFAIPSELKVHMRVHTGEQLFPCTVCEQTFTDSNKLRKHVQLHVLGTC